MAYLPAGRQGTICLTAWRFKSSLAHTKYSSSIELEYLADS
ncbi:hypothetical protein ACFLZ9_01470 [Patescibacteria group bacterium]